jgi:hypothetical protein
MGDGGAPPCAQADLWILNANFIVLHVHACRLSDCALDDEGNGLCLKYVPFNLIWLLLNASFSLLEKQIFGSKK